MKKKITTKEQLEGEGIALRHDLDKKLSVENALKLNRIIEIEYILTMVEEGHELETFL